MTKADEYDSIISRIGLRAGKDGQGRTLGQAVFDAGSVYTAEEKFNSAKANNLQSGFFYAEYPWKASIVFNQHTDDLKDFHYLADFTYIYSRSDLVKEGQVTAFYWNMAWNRMEPNPPLADFKKEELFNKFVLPRLRNFYNFMMSRPDLDIVIKNTIETWWEQKVSTFSAEFEKISEAIQDLDFPIDDTSKYSIEVNGAYITQHWFRDLFEGRWVKPNIVKPSILEAFGWTNFVRDNDGTWGAPPTFDGTIDGLQLQAKADPEWYKKVIKGTLGIEDATVEDTMNLRQCALVTGLLHRNGGLNFHDYINDPWYNSFLSSSNNGNCRIYPVDPKSEMTANEFINFATMDNETVEVLKDHSTSGDTMVKDLFWVYEASGSGEIREAQIPTSTIVSNVKSRSKLRKLRNVVSAYNADPSVTEARINEIYGSSISQGDAQKELKILSDDLLTNKVLNKGYYYLKEANIKFDGTNPSTARNDVQVSLKFELSSLTQLGSILVTLGEEDGLPPGTNIKLMDLITLPTSKTPSKKNGPGQYLTNHYTPNYSRLRLKVAALSKKNVNGHDALILDLALIDHSISRSSEDGVTILDINYRGYFESTLNMPFNDALASNDVIESRIKRQEQGLDVLMKENCEAKTVRQALRIEREAFSREARESSFSSILAELNGQNKIYEYNLHETAFLVGSIGGTLDSRKNYVKGISNKVAGFIDISEIDALVDALKNIDPEDSTTVDEIIADKELSTLEKKFFFLGDLMFVLLNCLYEREGEDSQPKHRDIVSGLNLRFMVSTINVPDPTNLDGPSLTINPICIPIDVSFFIQWFNSIVVNKGLSFYPVGTFIRDLIERLVNGVIYDTCFSLLLPDETPPILRSQYFSNDEIDFFKKQESGWFDPTDPFQNGQTRSKLFKTSIENKNLESGKKSAKVNSTNYCVIYQQTPSWMRQLKYQKNSSLKDSPYTANIYYGTKNTKYNYLNNVSFSKTDSPFLREARYNNNNFGILSLLSNVYDLSFSFVKRKANTLFYPGNIINFYLLDWGPSWGTKNFSNPPWLFDEEVLEDSNPHKNGTLSNVMGMGGYFTIKSVEYSLGETESEFEIKISCVFTGTDAVKEPNSSSTENERISDKEKCSDAFNVIADRANELYEAGDEVFSRAQPTSTSEPSTPNNTSGDGERTTILTSRQRENALDEAKTAISGIFAQGQLFDEDNTDKTYEKFGSSDGDGVPILNAYAKSIHESLSNISGIDEITYKFKFNNSYYKVFWSRGADGATVEVAR